MKASRIFLGSTSAIFTVSTRKHLAFAPATLLHRGAL